MGRRIVAVAALIWLVPMSGYAADTRLADAVMNRDTAAVRALLAQKVDVNAPGIDGTPALHWAVRTDDMETARLLLTAGADPKLANRYGLTPLALATSNGNAAMVGLLLEAGVDPNFTDPAGETPLMIAARTGDLDTVKTLLDGGAALDARDTIQQTPLMIAIRENHPQVAKLFVERGAKVSLATRVGETPRWVLPNSVPGFGHGVGIVRGGLPDRGSRAPIPGGMTALLYAARDGRLEVARLLVEAGADIEQADPNGVTPLLMAVSNTHYDVALFLMDKGADINVSDWYGRTPLWSAVETRNMEVDNNKFTNGIVDREPALRFIETLLTRGANPNVRTKESIPIRRFLLGGTGTLAWVDFTGQTPFLTAALSGDVTVMRLLLKHGADPHIPTHSGTTALMAAAGINWVVDQTYDEGQEALLEAVKLCVDLGMDVNAVNSMGLTAVHGAANRGSDAIIRFLVEKGARLDVKDKEGRAPLTWAEGVFLATHPAQPKPSTIELITKLMATSTTAGR